MRWAEFDRHTAMRGWTTDAERARRLGFSEQMLNHMRRGRANPGPLVIDCCVRVFGGSFYDVFFERREEMDAPLAEDVA